MSKTECYSMTTEVKHRRLRLLDKCSELNRKGFPRRSYDGTLQWKGIREGRKWPGDKPLK